MPDLKDERVLNVAGNLSVDPALSLRQRAKAFIASRQWSTSSIFYGDQPEPAISKENERPFWSACFCLGLDHLSKTKADWFEDVVAIIDFLQPIAREVGCEFIVEFRLRSRLWYSETLCSITGNPTDAVDHAGIRAMLTHFILPDANETFLARWGGERVRGKNRFIFVYGVLWWGLPVAFVLGTWFGHDSEGHFRLTQSILSVAGGFMLGVCVGASRWIKSEQRFKKLAAKNRTVV